MSSGIKYLRLEFESDCEPTDGELSISYTFYNDSDKDIHVDVYIEDIVISKDIPAGSNVSGVFTLKDISLPYMAEYKVVFQDETHIFRHEYRKPESLCVDSSGNPVKVRYGFGIPVR